MVGFVYNDPFIVLALTTNFCFGTLGLSCNSYCQRASDRKIIS